MNSNSSLAAVVVLYYPAEDLIHNISSYLSFINILYVVDNTDDVNFKSTYLSTLPGLSNKIIYIANPFNKGIAFALNLAATNALKENYLWLLTMDQDSLFSEKNLEQYISFFEAQIVAQNDIGVIAPSHKTESSIIEAEYEEVNGVITSGSIINLKAWQNVNGYNENLFVDEVDFDFCYRLKLNNYKILLLNNVYLKHSLGKLKKAGYLGLIAKRNRIIHSPNRVYSMVHNYLLVKHKYKKFFQQEFKHRDKLMLTALKNNLFFSGKFLLNFKNIIKGYLDFKKIKSI